MFVLIASYLLLVFVLPIVLSALVSYRALPVGRRCPQCGTDTIPLLARRLRLINVVLLRSVVDRRWCLFCRWEGAVRLPRSRPAIPPVETVRPATQTLDLRSLTVNGSAWRVMLQCWGNTGVFYGRLVFVGPSGRLWLDAVEAFTGSTEREVLGQALSLPEGLLENRLRRLVSG
ncbi:MAG TPA: hypothetical protein VMN60_04155 [Longimicrobiales bacterium]|nr:hypothetical protein [Longimicrobiales bacterium]